ncbi:MAG: NifB/NifX family molybdenum-iron cluster-binding protein [Candidatus Methanomethylophilaceae archaeon]|nr:NifB/NifX family molybdenum-iron cluster-binding protein [Candidatus Methanomethylophilaceae archaeon]
MKIAVAYDNGEVFQHFGRTESFKIYDVEDGKVVSSKVVGNGGQSHGGLVQVLLENKVDTFICGGIGGGARQMIESYGIRLLPGANGSADACVDALLNGSLDYDPETECHHHEGGSHSCSCGRHD